MGQWLSWLRAVASAHELTHWGAFQLLAMIATFAWFWRRSSARGEGDADPKKLRLCLLIGFVGGALGAVLLGAVLRFPSWALSGFQGRAAPRFELMAYGALLGLSATYAALARFRGFEPGAALDRLAPCLGILVVFGRAGCFVAGCDFGSVTEVPWAIRYPPMTAAFRRHLDAGWIHASDLTSLPVHPAQLYEAAVGLSMAAVGLLASRRRGGAVGRLEPGAVFASVAATYALGRLVVEAFRGDERGALGALSTPQWLSVTVVVSLALEVSSRRARAAGASALKER